MARHELGHQFQGLPGDGVLHGAGLTLGCVGRQSQDVGEEVHQYGVAIEHLVGHPPTFRRQLDGAVVLVLHQAPLGQLADSLGRGGDFDPPGGGHVGHLRAALAERERSDALEVVLHAVGKLERRTDGGAGSRLGNGLRRIFGAQVRAS